MRRLVLAFVLAVCTSAWLPQIDLDHQPVARDVTTTCAAPSVIAGAPVVRIVPVPGADALALDARAGRAFVAVPGAIRVVDLVRGALLRTVAVAGSNVIGPAVAVDAQSAHVFVANGTDASTGEMLDACSGALLRRLRIDAYVPWGLHVVASARRIVALGAGVSVLNATTGAFMVLGQEDGLHLFDAVTGATIARVARGFDPGAVDERTGDIYALGDWGNPGAPPARVLVLEGRSGRVRRTIVVRPSTSPDADGGPIKLALDARRGHLFIFGVDGGYRMVRATDGAVLSHGAIGAVCGAWGAIAVDGTRGHLFGLCLYMDREQRLAGGKVVVLDTRTGAVLRTGDLGASPVALALDERTGRVAILDSDALYLFGPRLPTPATPRRRA